MPAVSKKQQKFMGIVRSIQKGEQPASKFTKDAQDVAKDMTKKDVKKFASTKHKGLPMKKEMLDKLKEMVRVELESCGYTHSVSGKKLKSSGGTGPEDRYLKEMSAKSKKIISKLGKKEKEMFIDMVDMLGFDQVMSDYKKDKKAFKQALKDMSESVNESKSPYDNDDILKDMKKKGYIKKGQDNELRRDKVTAYLVKHAKKRYPAYFGNAWIRALQIGLGGRAQDWWMDMYSDIRHFLRESVNESYTLYHNGRPVTGFYTNAFPITKVVGTSTRSYISFKSEKSIKDDFKRVLSDVSKDDRFTKQDVKKLATMFKKMKIRKNESVDEQSVNEFRNKREADTARDQIGHKALYMIGAKDFMFGKSDGKNSLVFKIMRNSKGVSHIRMRLSSMDLYDIEFLAIRAGNIKVKSKEKGVYGDQLGVMIKKNTGLNIRL